MCRVGGSTTQLWVLRICLGRRVGARAAIGADGEPLLIKLKINGFAGPEIGAVIGPLSTSGDSANVSSLGRAGREQLNWKAGCNGGWLGNVPLDVPCLLKAGLGGASVGRGLLESVRLVRICFSSRNLHWQCGGLGKRWRRLRKASLQLDT